MTGEELKALRKKLQMSVTEAAAQVGVSSRAWQRWEAGTRAIPETAVRLFTLLNKS